MRTARSAGRIVGVLMLAEGAITPVVNFRLLGPAMEAEGGFLASAAAHSAEVSLAVLLMLVSGALAVGVAITVFPVFRRHSQAMALWVLALAVVGFAGLLVEGIALRSMLSLSQEYAKAGAADAAGFPALGAWAGSVRHSAHFTNFMLAGASTLLFYGVLLRFALVPRVLAGFGMVAALVLMAGAVIPLFGYPTMMLLFMPIGLSQLALMVWLLARGFADQPPPAGAAESPA